MIEKELTNQDGKLKFLGHRYDDNDNKGFLKLFTTWLAYKKAGTKYYQRANLPESLTEGLVAKLIDNTYRKVKILKTKAKSGVKTKFDCYNDEMDKIIEVKGCSVPNDLTSWSPKPFFDLFYFLDFSSLDGKYKIYEINVSSDSEEFLGIKNKNGTSNLDLMKASRRPRFSVYEHFINKKIGCDGNPLISGDLNTL